MTNVILIGDVHLNLRKYKDFQVNRFKEFQKIKKEHKADKLFILGDFFDLPKPTLEELSLFYSFIEEISRDKEIYLISGNHEDLSNAKSTYDFIPEVNFKYITHNRIELEDFNLYFTSHNHIDNLNNKVLPTDKPNLLFSHIRCDLGYVKEEFPLQDLSDKFDYVFLGDIHRFDFKPFDNVVYTSSPYSINFSEIQKYGYIDLCLDKGSYSYKFVDISDKVGQKIKVELVSDDVTGFLKSVKKDNLYKAVITDALEHSVNLPKKANVFYEFKKDISINHCDRDEIVEEIKNKGSINIIDTLKVLVRNSDEPLNKNAIVFGEDLLDQIEKGVV